MGDFTQSMIAFVQAHREWGLPVVAILAFSESFAFISLIVPATAALLGIGGIMAAAGFELWSVWAAAAVGAIAGDWLAYSLAFRFKDRVLRVRPFSRSPQLVARGIGFFRRWGMIAVFCGRFFGPFRAVVPIAAGLHAMPWVKFQIANFLSAAVWAIGVLAPGFAAVRWLVE
jgi:membrane protein DedA with SNARE-associated domain